MASLSTYQKDILKFVAANGETKTADIIDRFQFRYHHNGAKYVQEAIKRLVDNRSLTRVKHGHYIVNTKTNGPVEPNENQMKLF